MLVVADWVVRGLKKRPQGQVYAKNSQDDKSLFSKLSIDGVDVIQRSISVVETRRVERGRKRNRTYFVDGQRLKDRLLHPESAKKLQGVK